MLCGLTGSPQRNPWHVTIPACLWDQSCVSYQPWGTSDQAGPGDSNRRRQYGEENKPDNSSPANKGRGLQQSSESSGKYKEIV